VTHLFPKVLIMARISDKMHLQYIRKIDTEAWDATR
jgi:translation initiation factor IF-1